MKTRKIISVALALCLVLSVLMIGAVSASASDEVADGGWTNCFVAADNITEEEQAIFTQAMRGLGGADYEPKDVIATQVVAGTNYAFLCVTTPVVPNPESYWTIVTVYRDLSGNAKLQGIKEIDPAGVATLENNPEEASGAWESTVKENAADVADSIKAALTANEGLSLSPIAEIADQEVAGTNSRILCYGTLVIEDPVTNLYVVDVYTDLEGNSEITSISPFDLTSYIVFAPIEEEPEEEEPEEEEPEEEETEAPEEVTEAPEEEEIVEEPEEDSEGIIEEDETEAPTAAPVEPTADPNSKSPKTGSADSSLALLLILLAVAGAGVSVYGIAKKRG